MKRIGLSALVVAVVVLLASVLLFSGDEKSQVQTQKSCQGVCAGHDSVKCALEKGSAACLEKHKNNGCKGHKVDKCDPDKCSAECKEKCSTECKEKCSAESNEKCSKECLVKCARHDKPPK
jgi:hypothetical protein